MCGGIPTGMEAGEIPLVRDGRPQAVVMVLREETMQDPPGGLPAIEATVEDTAQELVDVIRRISGAELPLRRIEGGDREDAVREAGEEGLVPILLGSPALRELKPRSPEAHRALEDPSGFVIRASADKVVIAGSTPAAVGNGVYALLEGLGVRWFFPGELGTVIPHRPEIAIPSGETVEKPSLAARQFQIKGADAWIRHQRAGGLYFPSAHGIPLGKDATLASHPELFALVDGKRTDRQLCLSNPGVLKRAIAQTRLYFRENSGQPWLGMGPNDGGGFCECEDCRALDGWDVDPFSGGTSMTDRYVDFFNKVLDAIGDEFPNKQIAFYIYHNYMRPPVRVKPDARIAGAIAPIALCRIHGMNNSICPERGYLKTLIDEWKAVLPNLYERGYWYNLADPGMLFIQTHRLRDEIPYYAKHDVKGYRTECMGHWALQGPSLYVAGKLMWDAQADPDALTRDFCGKLFGPAAGPMEDYFTFLDHRMRDSDFHAGGALNLLQFYPPEIRRVAGGHVADAEKLATESPWKERVAIFAEGFAYFDAFARMLEAEIRQDWGRVHEEMLEMDAHGKILAGFKTPMLEGKAAQSHFARFFRHAAEQGYARTSGGNVMVAPLSPSWDFLTDPQSLGDELHYERETLPGGNWQKISSKAPWSDQGLRYYKGLAWYRQDVDVPGKFEGRRVFLWFGGVDETARVWVNGRLVGTSPTSAFTPFEVDATEALRPGKNTIAVCVANLEVNELGSGGITAPAFLYAPAKGGEAQLENLKPLRDTFP